MIKVFCDWPGVLNQWNMIYTHAFWEISTTLQRKCKLSLLFFNYADVAFVKGFWSRREREIIEMTVILLSFLWFCSFVLAEENERLPNKCEGENNSSIFVILHLSYESV